MLPALVVDVAQGRPETRVVRRMDQDQAARRTRWLWRLGGLGIRGLAVRVWDDFWEDELLDRAAALSFFFVLAMFPGLLFLTALFGLLQTPYLMETMLAYLARVMPGDSILLVSRILAEVRQGATAGLLSIGVLGALWSASSGMVSVMSALNVAYEVEDRRSWWHRRLIAIALTVGFSALILLTLILVVFGKPLASALGTRLGMAATVDWLWSLATWPIAVGATLAGITLVYYLAPAAGRRWHWITPGSVFALAGWIGGSYLLRLYVGWFGSLNKTYGSIGAMILLMMWLYVTSLILLVGAEIDSEITKAEARREEVPARERAA
ncbi:MAG TPA: YihY/virulence factor BrkB family protein [Candidatus Binatia bacterium]|nr:YihY/virulence factor BrkB family protein [Candidatus Binatia bacterium]